MKTTPIITLSAMLLLAGCTTTPQNPDTIAANARRVQSVTRLSVYAGTKAALITKPETREAFIKANTALAAFVAQSNWNATAAANVLIEAGIPAVSTEEGQLVLTGSVLLLDLFGPTLDLRDNAYSEAFIRGASDGLRLALNVQRPSFGAKSTEARLAEEAVATRRR